MLNQRSLEPLWQPYHSLKSKISPALAEWVLEPNSMTAKLRDAGGSSFRVNVIHHDWSIPRPTELNTLNLPAHSAAIVREIELICHNQTYIFARSVYPAKSMLGKNYILRHLGERPVGDIMYADPRLTRINVELAQLRPGHVDYNHAALILKNPPKSLWARRAVFIVNRHPLLISEIFLPTILE